MRRVLRVSLSLSVIIFSGLLGTIWMDEPREEKKVGLIKEDFIPDTPLNLGRYFYFHIVDEETPNYDGVRALLHKDYKGEVSDDDILKISERVSDANKMTIKGYVMLDYNNGEKILLEMTPERINGRFYIHDIIMLPGGRGLNKRK